MFSGPKNVSIRFYSVPIGVRKLFVQYGWSKIALAWCSCHHDGKCWTARFRSNWLEYGSSTTRISKWCMGPMRCKYMTKKLNSICFLLDLMCADLLTRTFKFSCRNLVRISKFKYYMFCFNIFSWKSLFKVVTKMNNFNSWTYHPNFNS